MSLPVLNLPLLAFDHIYQHLELVEIFELSQCSKRTLALITKVEKSRNNIYCRVVMGRNKGKIDIRTASRGQFDWRWYSRRDPKLMDVEEFRDRKIQGKDMKFGVFSQLTPLKWITVGNEGKVLDDLLFMFRYFRKIFNCQIVHLIIDLQRDIDFNKVFTETDDFHKAVGTIDIKECALEPWEMTFLLDHLKAGKLYLRGNPGDSFEYQKPLEYEAIVLEQSYWLSEQRFFEMVKKMEYLKLDMSILVKDPKTIKKVLKDWIQGDLKQLKYLALSGYYPEEEIPVENYITYENVLNGIPHSQGSRKREDASEYYERFHHYDTGKDLRRKDGKLGTFVTWPNHESAGGRLGFLVWDCEDPNEH